MRIALAILVGALVIAGSILFLGRWQIATVPGENIVSVYRLDRWSGAIEYCGMNPPVRTGGGMPTPEELFGPSTNQAVSPSEERAEFPVTCHRAAQR